MKEETQKNIKHEDASKDRSSVVLNWMASLMFIQFASRMLHFALNLVIVRFLSPESYGVSALQLPFVAMAVTRLFKEAVHRAALREKEHKEHGDKESTRARNLVLVWWSIPLSILLSGLIGFLFLMHSETVTQHPWMVRGFLCWLVASWLELAIEPVVIHLESKLVVNVTVIVECVSLLVQCLASIAMLFILESKTLVQSYGQLIVSACLFLGYYGYAFWWNRTVAQDIWPESFRITKDMVVSMKGFLIQSVGKYVTAEGEHAILFFCQTPEQQGLYEFVHNLGSIVARVAFMSIERTGFVMFTKWKNNDRERERVWQILLNVSLMISLLYLSTTPSYLHFVIHLLYGPKWALSSAPDLLVLYGVYLLLIGVNGLVEALRCHVVRLSLLPFTVFYNHRDAVSSYTRIQQQTPFMIFSIALYFVQGYFLLAHYGAAGLIIASCLSTVLRLFFNIYFFKGSLFPISRGFPSMDALLVYLLIFATGTMSRKTLGDTWKHLGFGILQGIFFLAWLYFFQWRKLTATWQLMREKNKAQ